MRPSSVLVPALAGALFLGACDRDAPAPGPAPSASAAAPAPAAAVTRAAITMDGAHDMMALKEAPAYTIGAATVLVIEIADHQFAKLDAGRPDAVHVAHGSSGYYRASFKGSRIELGPASLDPVRGRDAFPGFEAGETYVVAVGTEAPSADGALRFSPAWTARVTVQK